MLGSLILICVFLPFVYIFIVPYFPFVKKYVGSFETVR